MKVVNLFGGPNSKKSTTAYQLAGLLKSKGIQAELVTEYAKDLVWDMAHPKSFEDQISITAEQHKRQNRLRGKCDIVVTDSPILLGLVYVPENYFPSYKPLVHEVFKSFDNINFYIQRPETYNPIGRNQTFEEAKQIDAKIKDILVEYPYLTIDNQDAVEQILKIILPL